MPEAHIIDAVRTLAGRRKGGLSAVHPADLGAHVIRAVLGTTPRRWTMWCLAASTLSAGDIARTCWLAAGLPHTVPGVTIDRQCGSSQQAVHFAAQGVMSGTQDLVIAGVQNMTQIPISYAMIAAKAPGHTDPFSGSEGWVARYGKTPAASFRVRR